MDFDDGFHGFCLDAAHKKCSLFLPLIEHVVTLIATIHHARFSVREDLIHKGTFGAIARSEKDFSGNAVVEVKTDMGFGFPCTFPIIGPVHGKRRIYERSIDSDKLAKPGMAIRQYMSCLFLQILEDIHELLEALVLVASEKLLFLMPSLGAI